MVFKAASAFALTLALSGCSSTYDIRAVAIGGKLAFVPADTDIWGEPDCINSIMVSAVNGPPAAPAKGDNAAMVANGDFWNKSFASTSCDNPFPVHYGAELKGAPSPTRQGSVVEAKPLRIGVTYEVTTTSEGSAYGGGRFTITSERKVVNLPS